MLSTDPAHSLADALGLAEPELGQGPIEVAETSGPYMWMCATGFARAWGEIQQYLLDVLDSAGVDPMEAEELTVLPGQKRSSRCLRFATGCEAGNGTSSSLIVRPRPRRSGCSHSRMRCAGTWIESGPPNVGY